VARTAQPADPAQRKPCTPRDAELADLCSRHKPGPIAARRAESAICTKCPSRPPGECSPSVRHRLGGRWLPSRRSSVLTSTVGTYTFWRSVRQAAASDSCACQVQTVPPPAFAANSFSALQADPARVRTVLEFYARAGRFPRGASELADEAVAFVVRQVGVPGTRRRGQPLSVNPARHPRLHRHRPHTRPGRPHRTAQRHDRHAMEPASPGHRAAVTSAQRRDRCHGARRA
jgi:hypothetical protein